jgi:hypothetical protein
VTAWAAQAARAGERPDAGAAPARGAGGDDLRRSIGVVLAKLAARVDEALAAGLARAAQAWDQADSVSMIDTELDWEIAAARRRLAAAAHPSETAQRRAVAVEGLLVVDAAVGLTRLCERRLASLLRLRLRSATPELLPAGRPFLDLGGALREVAEAWR